VATGRAWRLSFLRVRTLGNRKINWFEIGQFSNNDYHNFLLIFKINNHKFV